MCGLDEFFKQHKVIFFYKRRDSSSEDPTPQNKKPHFLKNLHVKSEVTFSIVPSRKALLVNHHYHFTYSPDNYLCQLIFSLFLTTPLDY